MKTLVAGVLVLLLAGCATERYYPVYPSEGGGYYIAEHRHAMAGYGTGYDNGYASLYALGVYPWWVHTFYSPYFYPYYFSYYHPFYYPYYGPYHFAGWYPSWPSYAGYQSRYSWGWPPWHAYRHAPPVPPSTGSPPAEPGHGQPGRPVDRPVAHQPRRRAIGEGGPDREAIDSGVAPQRVTAPVSAEHRYRAPAPFVPSIIGMGRSATGAPTGARPEMPYSSGFPAAPVNQPMAPSTAGRPFSGEAARIRPAPSERAPAERDQ
jgi:hypothetical protein